MLFVSTFSSSCIDVPPHLIDFHFHCVIENSFTLISISMILIDFLGADPWVWIPGFGLLGLDSWVWSPDLDS